MNTELLARVDFPPYTVEMLTGRHILVGGGGGSSRTGIANGFEIFEISHNGHKFIASQTSRHDTGSNVVMNSAVYNNGKKIWLLAGQESHCQFYTVQPKVITLGNGEREGLRRRRQTIEELGNKGLQLILKPGDSLQTDFGESPLQRVVRINLDGNLAATGGIDGCVRVWRFPKMTKIWELNGHTKEIDDIDFSPDSKKIATVAKDGLLLLWDVKSGKKLKDLKSNFKRCRFQREKLFTISNLFAQKNGLLKSWNAELGVMEREVSYKEFLSELAVSDDGTFVAVGTMGSGSVDIFIAFSLQRILHVPHAHNMFVTNLRFLPTCSLDDTVITSNAEAAVISVSVDNKLCIHSIQHRRKVPFWLFLIFIVSSICIAFICCSYVGL